MKNKFLFFRLFSVLLLCCLVLPISSAAAARPTAITPDPNVQAILDQIDAATLHLYVRQLAGELPVVVDGAEYTITTRYTYSGTPIQKATSYVGQRMEALGLDVEYHVWNGTTYPNVIGEIVGQTSPDQIFIIGAHLDDVQGTPGADDNASGSVAVLRAAELLSQYEWGCTLRFAFWTGEEQGLNGSDAYAERSVQRGENIVGYLNLDMIAYNTPASTPGIDLIYHPNKPNTQVLAQLFADVVDAYDLNLVPELKTSLGGGSDHQSFWDRGYTSILAIEDQGDFNPYYHGAGDTPSNNDQAYFTEFVKAAIATFIHDCDCMITGQVVGLVTDSSSGLPLAGALVDLTDYEGEHHPILTDAQGQYHLYLMPGIYVARVSKYGYGNFQQTGVVVTNGEVTTVNAALSPLPFYTLSGTVKQAGSGLPLAATLTFDGAPAVAITDPSTGAYSVQLAQGSYTMHVRAAMHTPLAQALEVTGDATLNISLTPYPPVLVVDDDQNSPNLVSYYTSALDALGVEYDVWTVTTQGNPTVADLAGYCHLVWYTGAPGSGTLSEDDEAALSAYLGGGGSLLFSSHDYLLERSLNDFGRNYLGISSYQNNVRKTDPVGKTGDPLGDGLGPYTLSAPPGWTRPLWTDNVTGEQGSPFQWASTSRNNSTRYSGENFKAVFLAWPLEAIADLEDRAEVLGATLDWFGSCTPSLGQLSGQVSSSADSAPLVGAQVSVTPALGGPALTDLGGFYQLTLPAGDYQVTAQAACHEPQTVMVELASGGLTNRDFELSPFPPALTVSQNSFSMQLQVGAQQQVTFTLSNAGCQSLAFSLAENPLVGWLMMTPVSGEVEAGGSGTVGLTFSASGLAPGSYSTVLVLSSNDPQEPLVELPVNLTVVPGQALFLPALFK